jgi:pyruvate dehydrogenase E1 component alpha subunit
MATQSKASARSRRPGDGRESRTVISPPKEDVVMQPDVDTLRAWYREMLLVRRFEERARQAYQQGKIGGFLHLYIGEEAIATGAIHALKPQDHIVTHYRDHGHAIARGLDPKRLMAELFGRVDGYNKGRGGSMHFADANLGFWGGYAIVAGHLTIAVGLALAAQRSGRDSVVLAIFGDGATDNGTFYECLNFAKVWNLPVIFLCENNLFGMGVAIEKASAVTEVYQKACMADIPAQQVDGMDVCAVHAAFSRVVEEVRAGGGPQFVEAKTFRYQGHSVADPDQYRSRDLIEEWKQRDAIERLKRTLIDQHQVAQAEIDAIDADVEREMDEVIAFADASPAPDPATMHEHVYANPL